jgi:hypothetical protein
MDYPDAAVIAILVGLAISLYRRGRLLVLILPLPLVLAASFMRRYPLADRLALFLVPQLLLLIALAIQSLWTNFSGISIAIVLSWMILLPPAARAVDNLFHPPGREESLQAYRWIASQWQGGDVLYLSQFAQPSFRYYYTQSDWPSASPAAGQIRVQPAFQSVAQVVDFVRSLAGRKRVWVALIHSAGGPIDVGDLTLTAFNSIGHPLQSHLDEGAKVYLYDCSIP